MKRIFISLLALFAFAHLAFMFAASWNSRGCDFSFRYHEMQCVVKEGIDPYLIWSGDLRHARYCPFDSKEEGKHSVHTYPPWAYTFLYPFSLLSFDAACKIFNLLNVIAALFVISIAGTLGYRLQKSLWDTLFVAACAALFGGYALRGVLAGQNFGLLFAALLILMAMALKKKKRWSDIMAGSILALVMMKTHIGIFIVIPLLMGRRILTLTTGALLCILAATITAMQCDTSPVTMILQTAQAGKPYINWTPMMPESALTTLSPWIEPNVLINVSGLLGIFICIVLSWRNRFAESWLHKFTPPIICATMFYYSQVHDNTLYCIPLILLAITMLVQQSQKEKIFAAALIFLLCSSFLMYTGSIFGRESTIYATSFTLYCLANWVTVVGMCIWLYRKPVLFKRSPEHSYFL